MPCNGCGSCCDPVAFDVPEYRRNSTWMEYRDYPDPRTRKGWEVWRKLDWVVSDLRSRKPGRWTRARIIAGWLDAQFILEHWHDIGTGDAMCDAFDPETRRCTVYDERPPVCSGYPFYGRPPRMDGAMYPWCGYISDIEPEPVPVALCRK